MQKAAKQLALAVATHPSTVKLCALYTFRALRRLGREAEQTPDRVRSIVHDVREAWVESGQASPLRARSAWSATSTPASITQAS